MNCKNLLQLKRNFILHHWPLCHRGQFHRFPFGLRCVLERSNRPHGAANTVIHR